MQLVTQRTYVAGIIVMGLSAGNGSYCGLPGSSRHARVPGRGHRRRGRPPGAGAAIAEENRLLAR